MKKKNAVNLKSVGGMSAEIQESLNNFKVIIAFNRRDYFRKRFNEANHQNYTTAIGAGLANNIFLPVYSLFSGFAQLTVLAYGIYLISTGNFSIGLLVAILLTQLIFIIRYGNSHRYGQASRWQWQAGTGYQKFSP